MYKVSILLNKLDNKHGNQCLVGVIISLFYIQLFEGIMTRLLKRDNDMVVEKVISLLSNT